MRTANCPPQRKARGLEIYSCTDLPGMVDIISVEQFPLHSSWVLTLAWALPEVNMGLRLFSQHVPDEQKAQPVGAECSVRTTFSWAGWNFSILSGFSMFPFRNYQLLSYFIPTCDSDLIYVDFYTCSINFPPRLSSPCARSLTSRPEYHL